MGLATRLDFLLDRAVRDCSTASAMLGRYGNTAMLITGAMLIPKRSALDVCLWDIIWPIVLQWHSGVEHILSVFARV